MTTENPRECPRLPGEGWLVLIGGGEFSFEETEEADVAWLGKTLGDVGFVPAAAGSEDYAKHFTVYLDEYFARRVVTLPIYRGRDARRAKNAERIAAVDNIYVGGGVQDHLLDTLHETPCAEALIQKLRSGGTVVAIAAAAQSLGQVARSLFGGAIVPGLGWLLGGVVEPNFEPTHDRRLRQMLAAPRVRWGVGISSGGAVLLGPAGEVEVVGEVWRLDSADGELVPMDETEITAPHPVTVQV